MIHSIVPSPSVRSSVPPQNQIPERKLELSRKRSPLLPGESLPRPCEGGNLSPLEPSPVPATHLTPARSRMPETLHLPHRKPSHTSTYTPEPATAFILVRSFFLSSTPLQIASISRAVNFIFPRHFSLDVVPRRTASTPHRGPTVYRYLRNYRLNFTAISELCTYPLDIFKKDARVIFLLRTKLEISNQK